MKSFWRLPAYPAHTTKSQSQTTGLPFPARIIKRFNFQGTRSLVCFVTFVEVALPASKCQHLQALPFLYPAPLLHCLMAVQHMGSSSIPVECLRLSDSDRRNFVGATLVLFVSCIPTWAT